MSNNRLNFQYGNEKGISTDLEAEEQVLAYLMDVVNEYSENYNNSEYSSEEILKDIDSNPSKIRALTESINSIEKSEGLDFEKGINDYTASEVTDYEDYIESIGNDKDFLLNSIGAEAIDMSNKYYKSQDRIKGTPIKFNASKNTSHINSALNKLESQREEQQNSGQNINQDINLIDYDYNIRQKVMDSLTEIVSEYYNIYGNPEYDPNDILNGLNSNDDKIKALSDAIKNIGNNEGLDFNKVSGLMENRNNSEGNGEVSNYIEQLIENGDNNSLLEFLGAEGLEFEKLYQEHKEFAKENPDYLQSIRKDQEMTSYRKGMYDNGQISSQEFDMEWIENEKKLDETPFDELSYGNDTQYINKTLKGLESIKESEKNQTYYETSENETQLQEVNSKGFFQIIKEKLKNMFSGSKQFEENVMQPAEEQLGDIVPDEKGILEKVEEFIDKNVRGRINNLKEKTLGAIGETETFKQFKEQENELSKETGQQELENDGEERLR